MTLTRRTVSTFLAAVAGGDDGAVPQMLTGGWLHNPVTGELVIAEAEVRTKKTCDIHVSVDDGRTWFDGGSPMTEPWTDCSLQATNGPYITLQFTPAGTISVGGTDQAIYRLLER